METGKTGRAAQIPESSSEPATRILFVDDDALVRYSGEQILKLLGHDVLVAENSQVALDVYAEHGNTIRAVVLDIVMPVMNGFQALEALRKSNPDVKVLLTSGYTSEDIPTNDHIAFLAKPYSLRALSNALDLLIHSDVEINR